MLSTEGQGFITDWEKALHDALLESVRNTAGLRCFNHFQRNCKNKLNTSEIWKREDQKLYLNAVFENDEKAVLESDCENDLEGRLKSV